MEIDLDDKQKKLLLETLAKFHMIGYLQGKNNDLLEKIIQKFVESLKKEGKFEEIFMSVFQEKAKEILGDKKE